MHGVLCTFMHLKEGEKDRDRCNNRKTFLKKPDCGSCVVQETPFGGVYSSVSEYSCLLRAKGHKQVQHIFSSWSCSGNIYFNKELEEVDGNDVYVELPYNEITFLTLKVER